MKLRQDFLKPAWHFGRLTSGIGLKISGRLQGFAVIFLHGLIFHQNVQEYVSLQKTAAH